MIRIRLTDDRGPGRRWGDVLDESGNVIGSAGDYTYGGRGFAVHCKEYAGFVPFESVEFVGRIRP